MKDAQFLPASDGITDVYSVSMPDESAEDMTAAEKAANAAIEQLNSNAEKGQTIRIYRQLGSGKESMEFVAKYPADKYSIDDLIEKMQVEYGGGDYRFMIYNEKGRLSANKLISIAMKKETLGNAGGDPMAGVFSQYMNKQDMFMSKLLESNASEKPDRMAFMREMLIMKQLFAQENTTQSVSAVSQIKEMVEAMALLKTMSDPAPEQEAGFGDIIRDSMPLLTALASGGSGGQQKHDNVRPAPERKSKNRQKGKTMLNTIAAKLYVSCREDRQASDVADEMCEKVPNQFIEQFIDVLNDSEIIDKICAEEKRLTQYKKWLVDVVEWSKYILNVPSKFDDLTTDAVNDTVTSDEKTDIHTTSDTGG